jgi:hypothetical protein
MVLAAGEARLVPARRSTSAEINKKIELFFSANTIDAED